jgi:tRNA(adenine34) deaminase
MNERIIGRGHNRVITDHDPTAHAEIVALRDAAQTVENYRLVDATLYVTIEPCAMCAGALVNARIKRLVYGVKEEKAGAVESVFEICTNERLNHRLEVQSGVLEQDCREMIQSFFRQKRTESE